MPSFAGQSEFAVPSEQLKSNVGKLSLNATGISPVHVKQEPLSQGVSICDQSSINNIMVTSVQTPLLPSQSASRVSGKRGRVEEMDLEVDNITSIAQSSKHPRVDLTAKHITAAPSVDNVKVEPLDSQPASMGPSVTFSVTHSVVASEVEADTTATKDKEDVGNKIKKTVKTNNESESATHQLAESHGVTKKNAVDQGLANRNLMSKESIGNQNADAAEKRSNKQRKIIATFQESDKSTDVQQKGANNVDTKIELLDMSLFECDSLVEHSMGAMSTKRALQNSNASLKRGREMDETLKDIHLEDDGSGMVLRDKVDDSGKWGDIGERTRNKKARVQDDDASAVPTGFLSTRQMNIVPVDQTYIKDEDQPVGVIVVEQCKLLAWKGVSKDRMDSFHPAVRVGSTVPNFKSFKKANAQRGLPRIIGGRDLIVHQGLTALQEEFFSSGLQADSDRSDKLDMLSQEIFRWEPPKRKR
jgi:hypothetical protein